VAAALVLSRVGWPAISGPPGLQVATPQWERGNRTMFAVYLNRGTGIAEVVEYDPDQMFP